MKTRQIHGLGLGEFLIFAPAKEMLKSAYFFSALGNTERVFTHNFFIGMDGLRQRSPLLFFDRPSETQKEIRFFEAFESQSPMGKVALCPNLNV